MKYVQIQVYAIMQNENFISMSNLFIVFAILVYFKLERVYQLILFCERVGIFGATFLGPNAGWSSFRVNWYYPSTRYKVGWSCLRNLVISLSTMVLSVTCNFFSNCWVWLSQLNFISFCSFKFFNIKGSNRFKVAIISAQILNSMPLGEAFVI